MPSEEDLLLNAGFEEHLTPDSLPNCRRRPRRGPLPSGMPERRGRRTSHRRLYAWILMALLLHALPAAAYVLLNRLELLGVTSEGGTGWSRSYLVVMQGEPDLPPGPLETPGEIPPLPLDPVPEPEEARVGTAFPVVRDVLALASPASMPAFLESQGGTGPSPETPSMASSCMPRRQARGWAGGPVRGEGESLGSAGEREAPLWNPRPAYPDSARKAGWEGLVEIDLEVGADGRVVQARILSSSGFEALDRAALDALKRWRFTPRVAGAPARILRQEVVFRLENAGAASLVQK